MLANFLSKSKPINFIVFLGLFFCFFLFTLITGMLKTSFTAYSVAESVLLFILFLSIFFFYNFVLVKNKLTHDHSYAFFMFVLITILFIPKLIGTKILIVVLIYLLFLRKIYSLRSSKKIIQKLFDSGFWLGVLCILEPFSILFFVLIIASVLLQQKITIHTLITPIIGFSSPLFIYFSYLFWCGTTDLFLQIFYLNKISYLFIYAKDATIWIFGIIIILAIISIFLKSPSALSVNNSFKKSWILLFFNLVIATFFGLTIPEKNGSEVFFLMIPASIIIANGLEEIEKNKVKDYVFLFFLIGTFITFFLL